MKFRAAIFDIDGLLLDTEDVHWKSWNYCLSDFGLGISYEKYPQYVGGNSHNIAAEIIFQNQLEGVTPDDLVNKRLSYAEKYFQENKLEIFGGVKEFLEFCQNYGIKTGAASNGYGAETRIKLENNGLSDYFETVVSKDDVICGKPAPDLYLAAARNLQVDPHECLAFEDTSVGLASAKAAGMFCCVVPNRYTKAQDFSSADRVFGRIDQAVALLQRGLS
ncbi:MAG TPA: HAD family phosphatase [Candidatus Pacearchaeota archaeon]|nr:HAD family phosphatase [Candidatus Pacearchaeota archaeon]